MNIDWSLAYLREIPIKQAIFVRHQHCDVEPAVVWVMSKEND